MYGNDNQPETLISVTSDLEAAMIVSALAAHDIDATTTGGYTAGFRAEAPGEVSVLVRSSDLPAAQLLLREFDSRREDAETSSPPSSGHGAPGRSEASNFLIVGLVLLLLVVAFIRWV